MCAHVSHAAALEGRLQICDNWIIAINSQKWAEAESRVHTPDMQLACFYPVCIAAFACICYDDMFNSDTAALWISPPFISFLASVGHFDEEIQQNFVLFGQSCFWALLLCTVAPLHGRLCLRGQ